MRICIVGGCGHVGLPLGLVLAAADCDVVALDTDAEAVARVNSGVMPFQEEGADDTLLAVRAAGRFSATTNARAIADVDVVVVVIGTPVDDHLNPDPNAVVGAIEECLPYLNDGQLVMLRSTIYPGVTRSVGRMLEERGVKAPVVFCPERILEGHALRELRSLPQIVGAMTAEGAERAIAVFDHLDIQCMVVTPEEAELAKLFTNTWRYIKFAAANQFWEMANDAGLDFARIREAITFDYPRAADLPGPGFAAGPCLFKDAMQLSAFAKNTFALGHSAMLVNEGMPLYVVDRLAARFDLENMTVGILGMAFKAGSDDSRSSLSYKLKRTLRFRAKRVLTTDPYVTSDPSLSPLDVVLEQSDLLVIGAPHPEYKALVTDKPVIDVWDLQGNGTLV
ncbi:nucleotide sugar dehydrogenase [Terracoccus sp. 273MFTsu3.1]|uniref:nucleotide sugar dehydrogenase n=1 Tax=Terracoccus sp. 273MFTsu3.1 TaxID=1172188 RepID=UPI00048E627F|nr:nucleotide sugar dehydrogenase [Terracoccus sp. 273MFTsu3.1]